MLHLEIDLGILSQVYTLHGSSVYQACLGVVSMQKIPQKIQLERTLFTLLVLRKSRRLPDICPAKGDAQKSRGFAWRSLVDALTTTVIFRRSAKVYY